MNNDILNLVGKRLIKGEQKYGHENVTNDGRHFIEEPIEEALDLAVYVAAKLIEIKEKENQMGRAIDHYNILGDHERRIKLVEDALEEMIQTRVHHVDLTKENTIKTEGIEISEDKDFTPSVVTRKKTTRKAKATATT